MGNALNPSPINKMLSSTGKGKRVRGHIVGPTRSWEVGLIRSIPLSYHQEENENWLTSMYDDALQSCMYELAGSSSRFNYYPEITYLYNRQYGDNDDSSA